MCALFIWNQFVLRCPQGGRDGASRANHRHRWRDWNCNRTTSALVSLFCPDSQLASSFIYFLKTLGSGLQLNKYNAIYAIFLWMGIQLMVSTAVVFDCTDLLSWNLQGLACTRRSGWSTSLDARTEMDLIDDEALWSQFTEVLLCPLLIRLVDRCKLIRREEVENGRNLSQNSESCCGYPQLLNIYDWGYITSLTATQ